MIGLYLQVTVLIQNQIICLLNGMVQLGLMELMNVYQHDILFDLKLLLRRRKDTLFHFVTAPFGIVSFIPVYNSTQRRKMEDIF